MTSTKLLSVFLVVFLVVTISATPLKQRQLLRKLARQIEATTASILEEKTPYPAAGFRPHIPFELPNERAPKLLPTTTIATTLVEDFGFDITSSPPASTIQTPTTSREDDNDEEDEEVINHTPANAYGAPLTPTSTAEVAVLVDDLETPAKNFQLPTREAVENFGAETNVDVAIGVAVEPIADFPTVDESDILPPSASPALPPVLSNEAGSSTVDVQQQQFPADTYGAPGVRINVEVADRRQEVPAETYGAPDASANPLLPPVEVDIDGNVEENELLEDAVQIEVLSQLRDLKSGRLFLVPADGTNLREIYFADIRVPKQQRSSVGRLMRL